LRKNDLGLRSKAARRLQQETTELGVVINVQAKEKAGKNHFAYSAPGPIVVISGDRNSDVVRRKFPKKDIRIAYFKYDFDPRADAQDVHDIVKPIWKEVEELYWDALRSKAVRTIVCDTGTWFWSTIRLGKFGKTQQVPPVLYNQVNAIFERMILRGEEYNKNVIWLHRMKEEWVGSRNSKGKYESNPTGRWVRDSFKHMGNDVQANIELSRPSNKFAATVLNNGLDPSFDGMTFKGKMCDFSTVMAALQGGGE